MATFTSVDYEGALHVADMYCACKVVVVFDADLSTAYVKVITSDANKKPFRHKGRTIFRMNILAEDDDPEENLQNLIGGLTDAYYPKNPHISVLDDTNFPSLDESGKCLASFQASTFSEAIKIADAYCSLGTLVVYSTDLNMVWVKELSTCGEPAFHMSRVSFRMDMTHSSADDEDLFDGGIPSVPVPEKVNRSPITPPPMNIVILVVGTRGDVQPFIYFGLALLKDGHRVRLATHAEYREDVTSKGLEYYPLAGDPRKLSEYMVKTGGRLMPDLLNKEERQQLPEKMTMLKDICFSCYPACTSPDPMDPMMRPFLADAIISNPVSYGHIHVAEALSIPLHIMFPQPWYPTKMFPHPLSNMSFASKWSRTNYASFRMVDDFTWLGLGAMMNKFRKKVLSLEPLRSGESAASLLNDNRVPISHMWSPSFVGKCVDWPEHVDVVGEFRPAAAASGPSNYVPPKELADFLAAGPKPLYIGFGSMVIENPSKLSEIIQAAALKIGCRILLQSGWTKYAPDCTKLNDLVMVIGAMPHDWLFYQVAGVVHHGGAGTTSAGLRAGNPTFICPFFGDQYFWAEMISRAGAGPPGCRIRNLTTEKLTEALEVLRDPTVIENVKKLGEKMCAEDGVKHGVESFYRHLPLANMICEVSVFNNQTSKIARVFCPECDLKLSEEAHKVIHRRGSGRENHQCIPFRCCRWGVVGPTGVLSGINQGVAIASYELAGGLYDLFAKPIKGAARGGFVGAGTGVAVGLHNLFARPMRGGKIMVEKVISGAAGYGTLTKQKRTSVIEGTLAKEANESNKVSQRAGAVPLTRSYTMGGGAIMNKAATINFSRMQTGLGLAALSLSGELWQYVKRKAITKSPFSSPLLSTRKTPDVPDSTTRSPVPSTREALVDESVTMEEGDRVVYSGDSKLIRYRDRNKRSEVAVTELKRYSTYPGEPPAVPDDTSMLTADELGLDVAYKKALHLMNWWKDADKDGDRCINEKELQNYFPSKDIAKELLDMLDIDGDRLITFTEMSWVVCKALSI